MTKRLILMLPQSAKRAEEFARALRDAQRTPDVVENPMGGGGSESEAVETGRALTHAVASRGTRTVLNIANPYFTVDDARESAGLTAAKGVRQLADYFNTVVVVARAPVIEGLREFFTGEHHIVSPDEAVVLESPAWSWERFISSPALVTVLAPGKPFSR